MKKGWEVKKLGEVCEVIAGQSPKSVYYNDEQKGLPFYQGKKEFTNKFIGAPKKWTVKVTKESLPGDILMSVRAPVGPVNITLEKICIGRGLAAIRPKEKIIRDYLFNYLKYFEDKIIGNDGAVFNSINKSQIKEITLPLPPIPEQKRIVSILDSAFAEIDKAKANIEKNIANAEELFQSKLDEVFSQRGEGWEEKKFSDCFKLKSGEGLTKRNMIKGDYKVFGGNGVAGYHNDFNLTSDNIVIGRVGALCGNVRYINERIWLTDNAFRISEFNYDFDLKFLEYLLNFKNLRKYARQSAQPVISNSSLSKIKLIYPQKISEQIEISEKFDNLKDKIKVLIEISKERKRCLGKFKKSILEKAFTDEL